MTSRHLRSLAGSERKVVPNKYDKGAEVTEAVTLRTGDILIPKISGGEPLRIECEHFISCIENDQTPRSDGANGLRVVKVLEAGDASLNQDGELIQL